MALRNKVIFSDENNNVGIGEAATSGYRLLVKDTATNSVPLRLIGTNNYNYDFSSLSNGVTNGTRLDMSVGSAAGEFSFTNSGGELVRIDSSGNVLIGDTSLPASPTPSSDGVFLFASGGIKVVDSANNGGSSFYGLASSTNVDAATAAGYTLSLFNLDSTDGNLGGAIRFGKADSLSTSYIGGVNVSHTNRDGALVFGTSNGAAPTERMRIAKDGKVGIGTVPDHTLHVKDAADNAVVEVETSATNGNPAFRLKNDAREWQWQLRGAESDSLVAWDVTGGAGRLYLTTSGRLAIGQGHSNPAATLHVEYQASTPLAIFDEMLLTSTNSSQGAFGSQRWGWYGTAWSRNASSFAAGWGSGFTGGTGGGNGDFGVHTVNDTCAQNTDMNSTNLRFVVKNDGKVGIGTPSPDSALHLSLGGTTDQGDIAFTIGNDSVTARQGRILKNTSSPYDMYYTASMNNTAGSCILFESKVGSTTVGIDRAGAVAITPDCMCDANPLGTLCLDITGSTNPQNGGIVMNSTSQTHIRFLSSGNLCWQWRHHSPAACDVFSVFSWKRNCDMFMIKAPIDTDTGFTSFGPYGHIISCAPLFVGNISNDPYFINNGGNKCIRFYSYCFGTTSCFPQTHFMVRWDSSLTNVCQVYPTATLYNANETEGTSSTLAFAGREAGGGNSVGLAYISGRKEASVANSWANGSLNFLVNCDGCQCWTTCMTMCGGVCVIKCLVAPIIQMADSDCILCLATGGSPGAYFQGSADCTISYWGIDSSWKAQINSTGGFCAANCVVAPYVQGTCVCGTTCVYSACGCFADLTAADGVVPCSTRMYRYDDRCVCASGYTKGHLYFGFGSYDNDNLSDWADWLLLSSYTDSSGGNINFLTINRNGFGMRLYQRGWANSSTPSSTAFGTDNYVEMIHSANISSYVTGTTINNNADNRVITGSGTADTLNGEANLIFDGNNLCATNGYIKVSGNPSAGVIGTNGNGSIGGLTSNGLFLYGKGSTYDVALANAGTNVALAIPTGTTNICITNTLSVGSNITAAGDITSTSDCRVKSDINSIDCAIFIVNSLCGRRYIKDDKKTVGVIAQEVEKVLPEVVHSGESEDDMKSVSYGNITAVLIEAIKEQQKEIELLKRIVLKNGNSR